ncbi:MAG: enoyl-CoA hydratase/isomerase family protein, partial [Burkholderiales bacterium]
MAKDVASELKDRVGTVEIRRPPNNFFDNALIAALGDAFDAFDRDDGCRAIVLAAEGKAFCAGADFANRPATGAAAEGSGKHLYKEATRLF